MNTLKNAITKPIAIFLLFNLIFSTIWAVVVYHFKTPEQNPTFYFMAHMWIPGVSALLTMKIFKMNLKKLGWKWGKTKYQFWSYLIPILYAGIAYAIVWLFGLGKFSGKEIITEISNTIGLGTLDDKYIIALFILEQLTLVVAIAALFSLGEEIGWRGFLVPELYKTQGFTKTSFITGIIWGIWHFPGIFLAGYNSGTTYWYEISCFFILVISMCFILTWIRIKSGNLWTATILHASHNVVIQNIFTPLTSDTGNTAYYIDEFGIVIPIITVLFALYFWTKRKELKPLPDTVRIA